ncbi:MAG: hypothetical protein ABIV43_01730 [Candidatus Saccharimonadales bacterium]
MKSKSNEAELQRLRTESYIEETGNIAEEVGGIALRGSIEHIFTLVDPNKLGVYINIGLIYDAAYPGLGHYMAKRIFEPSN